jgi:hypothetical protein
VAPVNKWDVGSVRKQTLLACRLISRSYLYISCVTTMSRNSTCAAVLLIHAGWQATAEQHVYLTIVLNCEQANMVITKWKCLEHLILMPLDIQAPIVYVLWSQCEE